MITRTNMAHALGEYFGGRRTTSALWIFARLPTIPLLRGAAIPSGLRCLTQRPLRSRRSGDPKLRRRSPNGEQCRRAQNVFFPAAFAAFAAFA